MRGRSEVAVCRFTQERGRRHSLAFQPTHVVDRSIEIGLQKQGPIGVLEAVVRSAATEVEEKRVEACTVPVDQPELLAAVDQIGGEQDIVAENVPDLALPDLEPGNTGGRINGDGVLLAPQGGKPARMSEKSAEPLLVRLAG